MREFICLTSNPVRPGQPLWISKDQMPPKQQAKRNRRQRRRSNARQKKSGGIANTLGKVAGVAESLLPLLMAFPTSGRQVAARPANVPAGVLSVDAPAAQGAVVCPSSVSKRTMRTGERMEEVEVVATADDFAIIYSQLVNPGNPAMFPWLSRLAGLFTEYKFHKLEFIFEPSSATTQTGNVFSAFQYDSTLPDPLAETAFMALEDAKMSPAWFASTTMARLSDLNVLRKQYISYGTEIPEGSDSKTLFPAKFILAAQGMDITEPVAGRLYVRYDVSLTAPKLDASSNLQASVSSGNFPSAPSTSVHPFGDTPVIKGNMQLEILSQTQGDNTSGDAAATFNIGTTGSFLLLLSEVLSPNAGSPSTFTSSAANDIIQVFTPAAVDQEPTTAYILTATDPTAIFTVTGNNTWARNWLMVLVQWNSEIDPIPGTNAVSSLTALLSVLKQSGEPKLTKHLNAVFPDSAKQRRNVRRVCHNIMTKAPRTQPQKVIEPPAKAIPPPQGKRVYKTYGWDN